MVSATATADVAIPIEKLLKYKDSLFLRMFVLMALFIPQRTNPKFKTRSSETFSKPKIFIKKKNTTMPAKINKALLIIILVLVIIVYLKFIERLNIRNKVLIINLKSCFDVF